MGADLTLPGSIPGLLRRSSPVVLVQHMAPGSYWFGSIGAAGVVHRVEQESIEVALYDANEGDALVSALDTDLALDLTDATGRAHADWFWRRHRCSDLGPDHWSVHSPTLGGGYGCSGFQGFPEYAALLADLDPADPRLLPDGSRWVDAEALRRVVLHVAGVPHG